MDPVETEGGDSRSEPPSPRRIGPYAVRAEIGRGGMGCVYEGVQDEPLLRRVAIKVVRSGSDPRGVIRRFEIERRSLALMSHPNIAQVFEAGSTEDGRPYFAMELVDGPWITR